MEEKDIVAYLKRNLHTRYMGKMLQYMVVTASTMDEAKRWAEKGAPSGSVVIAGRQEAGRGRMGRSWLSPEGSLATSLILHPSTKDVYLLPAIASVAVFRAISKMGIRAEIKWPNDVLISGKKVCGILIDNVFKENTLVYSVVGIGININLDASQFQEIAEIATSLSTETGKHVPIQEVALNLYIELENLYNHIGRPGFIINEWINNMVTIGRRVTINASGCIIEGTAEAVNPRGNLILRLDDGEEREIVAGDVSNASG